MKRNSFKKVIVAMLGGVMALGVGIAVGVNKKDAAPVYAAGSDSTSYALITKTSDLEIGKSYLITNGTSGTVKTMAVTSNTSNRPTTNVTVSNGVIIRGSDAMSVTLGGSSGAWTLATDNYAGTAGYLGQGNQTKNNYLKVYSSVGTNGADTWTISFDGDAAVIKSNKKTTRNIIRCNTNGTPISCYTSGQNDVYLWKELSSQTIFSESGKNTVSVGGTLQLSSDASTTVTWSSSSTSVATVDSNGLVTGVSGGSATITAKANGYADATFSVTVTSTEPYLTLDKTSFSGYTGATTTLTATYGNLGGSLTWKTSDASIASISSTTGTTITVTLESAINNSAVITAFDSSNENTVYASCTITVVGINTYYKVTDEANVYSGMTVALVYESNAKVAGELKSDYLTSIDATSLNDGVLKSNDAVQFTIGGTAGAWTLTSSTGLLGATAAKSINLSGKGTTTWNISIEDGDSLFDSTNESYGSLQYNVSAPRFTTYASGQKNIQLYAMKAENSIYSFISNYMRMGDTKLIGTGSGACSSNGYYEAAKTAFNALNETDKVAFFNESNTQYEAARLRLSAWAAANGESFNTTDKILKLNSELSIMHIVDKNSNSSIAIIIIASLVGLTTIGGYFFLKKKRA